MAKDQKEKLPWFPCEQGPLLEALSGLKTDQKLVYLVVLLRIYDVGGPLDDSLDSIAMRCGVNKRRVTEALDALFKAGKLHRSDGGGIMNQKAHEVLEEMKRRRGSAKSSGAEGGRARWEKTKGIQQNGSSNPIVSLQPADSHIHEHIHKQEESLPLIGGGGARAKAPASEPGRKRAPKPPATTIAPDWTPSPELLAYASDRGFDQRQIATMVEAFRNHHLSRRNRYEWSAAWRTWVLNEVKFEQRRRGGNLPRTSGSGPGGRVTFADLAMERTDEKPH